MVSVTNISSAQAEHYYRGQDNYYASSPGRWYGKGAEALGLSGEVQAETFAALLEGSDPRTGEELAAAGGADRKHRAGIDLTFSAPKSVSILSEVLGEEGVRQAHERAVERTLAWTEEHCAYARTTEDGRTRTVKTGNLVIASYRHDTSRELDPQLHTHAVVLNVTRREDGQWRALSNEEIYRQKMLLGQHYRNELAAELREQGYDVRSGSKGLFEVRGVDEDLIEHYSRRSKQIEEKVKELRESGKYPGAGEQKLREIATLGSRVAKRDVDPEAIRQSWRDRLEGQGYSIEGIRVQVREAGREPQRREHTEASEYIRLAAGIETEQESAVTREGLLRTAAKLSLGEHRIGDLEAALDLETGQGREIVRLDERRYTTPQMQRIEEVILDRVREGQDTERRLLTPQEAQEALEAHEKRQRVTRPGYELSDDQRRAAEHILTSEDRYIGIQGGAGTGKTTMLEAVREQAEREGYEVKGYAPTGRAAVELEDAGIKSSRTIDSFLLSQERSGNGREPERRQLWIIDESSMVGSRKMHQLIDEAEKQNARVVMVGDTRQLQAIEAGPVFDRLQKSGALRTIEMSEIQRQTEPGYRDAAQELAARRTDRALDKLESQGRIREINDRDQRLHAVVSEAVKDDKQRIVVTAGNADRRELNDRIREELREQGRISREEITVTIREPKNLQPAEKHFAQSYDPGDLVIASRAGILGRAGAEARVLDVDRDRHTVTVRSPDGKEREIDLKTHGRDLTVYSEREQVFSAGDRVVFLKNDRGRELSNGQAGQIKELDRDGNVKVTLNNGKTKDFNLKTQYNYIDHGYAVTAYKAQGQTSREVIYHADTGRGDLSYNQVYVAATRGREDIKIVTDDKEQFRERAREEQTKTFTLDRPEPTQGHDRDHGKTIDLDLGDRGGYER